MAASYGTLGLSWSATWRHWADALLASSWAKAVATKAWTTRRPCLPAWARRVRKRAIIAVARKLLVTLWRYAETGP